MKTILSEKFIRVIKNKKKLEEVLKVKITNRGKEISISGKAEDEYVAEKVIDALNFGFPFSNVLEIKEQNFTFEILNIKDYTKKQDLKSVRARIIGTQGKTLSTLTTLTLCHFEIKDNEIGIIGRPEHIENAQNAIISIVKGAKQTNIYSYLEKHQIKPTEDLGLKEGFK